MFNTTPSYIEYVVTNPADRTYDFGFKIFHDYDLELYGSRVAGSHDLLVLGTDYQATVNGDLGGTVTLTFDPVQDELLTIERRLDVTRLVDYQQNGDLLAETLDADQDYQTYLTQDREADSRRTLKIPRGSVGVSTEFPVQDPFLEVENAFFRWSNDGSHIINDLAPRGPAGQIFVNSTVTGAYSTPATVTNVGTAEIAQLDFVIPEGIPGPPTPLIKLTQVEYDAIPTPDSGTIYMIKD